ncbi:MAG: NADPH:quinone reductase [Gammaproteobacteria bacterium HGW-Gammaproteobacteria-14]|nr:MAG: NADPH:quinone reductase [Gammaproteobacteria bacterium HGW-Gammaproteobacteria-14]
MNILVILGHPDRSSLSGALAEAFAAGACEAGATVKLLRLGELEFDPILWHGYRGGQPLEADIQQAQEDILQADHLVWVFPIWWGGLPALLKGFIDRVFLPGFAFRYRRGSSLWDRLLAGRKATVLATMDSPVWYYRWVQHRPAYHQLRHSILGFSGITPMRWYGFGPVRTASQAQRETWIEQARVRGIKVAANGR